MIGEPKTTPKLGGAKNSPARKKLPSVVYEEESPQKNEKSSGSDLDFLMVEENKEPKSTKSRKRLVRAKTSFL